MSPFTPLDDLVDLLFIKFDTRARKARPHDELKRRDDVIDSETLVGSEVLVNGGGDGINDSPETRRQVEEYSRQLRGRLTREHLHESLLWKSANPAAEALHKLDARAPSPPGCPGDGSPGIPLGLGMPDSFLSIFHPNAKGHEAMAAYALQNLVYLRAKVLDVDDGMCSQTRDDFSCWQKEGRKAFVTWDRLDENYKDFCDDVKPPADTVNWKWKKTYHEGTPDEHEFVLQLSNGASSFNKDKCLSSFDRIINSCDGNDPKNPLNLKFGGRWALGSYEYQINPKKDRKMFTKRDGVCRGWWKVLWTSYRFYGRGWATYDSGQKTLLHAARKCGAAITAWSFHYCADDEDCGGYEWRADLRAPVYFAMGCFRNNWVAHQAGGETYEDWDTDKLGCGGPNA